MGLLLIPGPDFDDDDDAEFLWDLESVSFPDADADLDAEDFESLLIRLDLKIEDIIRGLIGEERFFL